MHNFHCLIEKKTYHGKDRHFGSVPKHPHGVEVGISGGTNVCNVRTSAVKVVVLTTILRTRADEWPLLVASTVFEHFFEESES